MCVCVCVCAFVRPSWALLSLKRPKSTQGALGGGELLLGGHGAILGRSRGGLGSLAIGGPEGENVAGSLVL